MTTQAGVSPAPDLGTLHEFHGVQPVLPVSDVTRAAQVKAMKQVSGSLKIDLAQYRELAAFAQFGSDLDAVTQKQLARGERLVELLKQDQSSPLSVTEQVVSLYAGTKGYLDALRVDSVKRFESELLEHMRKFRKEILDDITAKAAITKETEEKLTSAIKDFQEAFVEDAKE